MKRGQGLKQSMSVHLLLENQHGECGTERKVFCRPDCYKDMDVP